MRKMFGWILLAWSVVKPILDGAEHIHFLTTLIPHLQAPDGIMGWLINPPSWITLIVGIVGLLLIASDIRRHRNLSNKISVPIPPSITPAIPPSIVPLIAPPVSLPSSDNETKERVFVGESITPKYLHSFFRDHISIQAARLTHAYIGKWITVAGILDQVSTALDQSHIWVTFKQDITEQNESGSVAMMFCESWSDRLAIFRRGDKITVVGQIEKIDTLWLVLENCELI